MVASPETIKQYMKKFEDDEVFILLEAKVLHKDMNDRIQYNYQVQGKPARALTCLAELVQYEANIMHLSFDEAMEVMRNMHMTDDIVKSGRKRRRIERDTLSFSEKYV